MRRHLKASVGIAAVAGSLLVTGVVTADTGGGSGSTGTTPMYSTGYRAQTAGPDGNTTLILDNGMTESISDGMMSALAAGRQQHGLPPIPTVSSAQAQTLEQAAPAQ